MDGFQRRTKVKEILNAALSLFLETVFKVTIAEIAKKQTYHKLPFTIIWRKNALQRSDYLLNRVWKLRGIIGQ